MYSGPKMDSPVSRPTRARGLKRWHWRIESERDDVAPHAGAWIETPENCTCGDYCRRVAPHAGAWIETTHSTTNILAQNVAPHAGAWIETVQRLHKNMQRNVAPHAGAWIETLVR